MTECGGRFHRHCDRARTLSAVSEPVNNETNETIGDWQLSGTRGRPGAVLLQTCCRLGVGACLQNDKSEETEMAWTRPKLREICIGMEINGYFAGTL